MYLNGQPFGKSGSSKNKFSCKILFVTSVVAQHSDLRGHKRLLTFLVPVSYSFYLLTFLFQAPVIFLPTIFSDFSAGTSNNVNLAHFTCRKNECPKYFSESVPRLYAYMYNIMPQNDAKICKQIDISLSHL